MSRRRAKQTPEITSPERTGGRLALFRYCLREHRWSVAANFIASVCDEVLDIEAKERRGFRSAKAARICAAEWSQLIGQLNEMMIAGILPFRGPGIVSEYENSDPGIFLDWCARWMEQRVGDVAG